MTRYDHIRSMPIEQMVDEIDHLGVIDDYCKSDCGYAQNDYNIGEPDCKTCIMRWLQEEVKNKKGDKNGFRKFS